MFRADKDSQLNIGEKIQKKIQQKGSTKIFMKIKPDYEEAETW